MLAIAIERCDSKASVCVVFRFHGTNRITTTTKNGENMLAKAVTVSRRHRAAAAQDLNRSERGREGEKCVQLASLQLTCDCRGTALLFHFLSSRNTTNINSEMSLTMRATLWQLFCDILLILLCGNDVTIIPRAHDAYRKYKTNKNFFRSTRCRYPK